MNGSSTYDTAFLDLRGRFAVQSQFGVGVSIHTSVPTGIGREPATNACLPRNETDAAQIVLKKQMRHVGRGHVYTDCDRGDVSLQKERGVNARLG